MPHLVRKISDSKPKDITCGVLRYLAEKEDFQDMDFAHVTIVNKTKKHYHKKLTEVYYVLKGKIAVEIDGQTENLETGSMIMIYPNTNHQARKVSEEPAEILVVCSPPWGEEDEILV